MAGPGFLERVRQRWGHDDTWPPHHVRKHWQEIEAYRRRYRNDRAELIQFNPNIMVDDHKVEVYTPVPWPRELCRFSAALLFAEAPQVSIPGHKPQIDEMMEVNDFGAFAIRGAVRAASEGRVGIRVIRDSAIDDNVPLLSLVNEDQIIWDIRHGAFYAGGMVVITRKVDPNDVRETYRLLEEHTKGLVTRFLYKGTDKSLGKQVALSSFEEFASLEPVEHTGLDKPTLIPWENVPGAESDLFGMGPLFDELNEAETLLLDRGRKVIPRVFVDKSLADETGRLQIDGYIFTGGNRLRLPIGADPGQSINVVQPNFLANEHIAWVDHVTQLMVTCAGYSPLTWGIQGHTASVTRAVSGYAMKLSQLRTLLNRSAKEHMALQALGWGVATVVAWMEDGGGKVSKCLPSIELGDGLPNDPLDGAQEVLWLRQALAASTETLVKTIHPTWTPEQITEEVNEINANSLVPPGAGPALGLGNIPKHIRALLDDDEGHNDTRAGAGTDPAPSTV